MVIDLQTPTAVYAGTFSDGVFKSTDGGGNWTAASGGLTTLGVRALALDPLTPTTLYAGTGGGVFTSTDGGGSWSATSAGLTSLDVLALAVDPLTPTTLYAGTGGGGVFRSTDGGGSWSAVSAGLTNLVVRALAVDPQTPTTVYAGTRGGVFKSMDAGDNWSDANGSLSDREAFVLAADPFTPTTIYLGTINKVYKSTDGGGSWSAASAGLTSCGNVRAMVIDPQIPTTLYAAMGGICIRASGGVFRSTDGGGSWSVLETGLPPGQGGGDATFTNALAIDPQTPTVLYAGTRSVIKSTDGGDSWSGTGRMTTRRLPIQALDVDPRTPTVLYAGAGSVFKSTDGGGIWSPISNGMESWQAFTVLAIDPLSPSTVYAGTSDSIDERPVLFKTTNGGATWARTTGGAIRALAIDPQTPGTLYVDTESYSGYNNRLYKSTDGGSTWSATGLTPGLRTASLVIDPATPTTLYAATRYSATSDDVFKSTDGGASWSALNTGMTAFQLVVDPRIPTTLYAATNDGVMKSIDGGDSWSAVNAGLTDLRVTALAIDPATPSTLQAGTRSGGVFKSTDAGGQWKPINAGLTDLSIRDLKISPARPTTLYALTTGGALFVLDQSSAPFSGQPVAVPGLIQAEDFDRGGEGVAYHDNVPGNAGGLYRPEEDVDIISPGGSGYVVNNFETGEWLEYTIDVSQAGVYRLETLASSEFDGSGWRMEVDGVDVTGPVTVPNTGSWMTFQWVGVGGVSLTAGRHVLRIRAEQEYFNLDALRVILARSPFSGQPAAVPGLIQAEDFDRGGEGVAYHDNVPGNAGGLYRPEEDVDIISPGGSGYVVNNFETGEWLEYTVSVSQAGVYRLEALASSEFDGSGWHAEIDGADLTGPVTVPHTGSWRTFEWVGVGGVSLTAGTHVLRIQAEQEYFNLDALRIVP